MLNVNLPVRLAGAIIMSCALFFSCSKGGSDNPPDPPAPDCASLTLSLEVSDLSNGCNATGKITATASGGAGLTFKLDNGAFQALNVFNDVAAGDHTITVKDNGSCSKSAAIKVTSADPGPLFAAVKQLAAANCVSCHNASVSNGGMNWSVDCNIVTYKDRIKARAVDGNPSFMPQGGQLSQADKNKITDWINAGGKYSD